MKIEKSLVFVIPYLLMTFSLHAGEISDSSKAAEILVENGKEYEGYKRLQDAVDIAWEKMPLIIENANLANSASGYGLYVERPNSTYKKEEEILIYAEVLGYGYGADSIGSRTLGFDIGIRLYDNNGKIVFTKKEWVSLNKTIRHKNREFFLEITLNPTNLPATNYSAILDVRDKNSAKTANFEIEFEILK